MFNKKVRINAVEVIVNSDLSVVYRLTLPLKPEHAALFHDRARIKCYAKNDKVRYYYEYESSNRDLVISNMVAAQLLVNGEKIKELQMRGEILLSRLSNY